MTVFVTSPTEKRTEAQRWTEDYYFMNRIVWIAAYMMWSFFFLLVVNNKTPVFIILLDKVSDDHSKIISIVGLVRASELYLSRRNDEIYHLEIVLRRPYVIVFCNCIC